MINTQSKIWLRWFPPILQEELDDSPVLPITKMVVDFEMLVPGFCHTIGITRSPYRDGHWWLVYSLYPDESRFITRTIDLARFDNLTVQAKHREMLGFLKQLAAQGSIGVGQSAL